MALKAELGLLEIQVCQALKDPREALVLMGHPGRQAQLDLLVLQEKGLSV